MGDFVLLMHGLKNAKHYNGIVAVVVEDKNKKGRFGVQLLDHQEGWEESASQNDGGNLQCAGMTIAAKEPNLSSSQDYILEKSQKNNQSSVHEIITTSPIGLQDDYDCEVLCQFIWIKK